jgi:hypothetical protein
MAIKRSTKGMGTPTHKPVATAPLRHVNVRPPQQMLPGEAPDDKPTAFDDQLTAIKCPHCGDEDLYRHSHFRPPLRSVVGGWVPSPNSAAVLLAAMHYNSRLAPIA